MIWEYMLKGMCHGGYVIGLILSLGVMVGVVALFCAFMGAVFGDEETNKNRRRN